MDMIVYVAFIIGAIAIAIGLFACGNDEIVNEYHIIECEDEVIVYEVTR